MVSDVQGIGCAKEFDVEWLDVTRMIDERHSTRVAGRFWAGALLFSLSVSTNELFMSRVTTRVSQSWDNHLLVVELFYFPDCYSTCGYCDREQQQREGAKFWKAGWPYQLYNYWGDPQASSQSGPLVWIRKLLQQATQKTRRKALRNLAPRPKESQQTKK